MISEVRKIYLANFAVGLSTCAGVIYTLYFLSHGLSQMQISQLFSLFLISYAIFDIPTGALSDMFGHKRIIIIGLIIDSLSGLFFAFAPSMTGFITAMLLAALGLAFQSGAWSSMTYEILEKHKLTGELEKVNGKIGMYYLIAGIIGAPIGSFIYKFYPKLPFILFFLCIILAAIITLFIPVVHVPHEHSFKVFAEKTKLGVVYTLKNHMLVGLMIMGVALTTTRILMNQNMVQPYQISIGVDVALIGVVAAAIQIVLAYTSSQSHKITNRLGEHYALLVLFGVPAAMLYLLSRTTQILGLLWIGVFYAAHAYRDPLIGSITQRVMKSGHRATMSSTFGFLITLTSGLLLPFFGKTIDRHGIQSTFLYMAVWTLLAGSAGLIIYRRYKTT